MTHPLTPIQQQAALAHVREGNEAAYRAVLARAVEPQAVEAFVSKERAIESLHGFLLYMWDELHPFPLKAAPFLRVQCDFIQKRLSLEEPNGVLCVPPGSIKSVSGPVFGDPWNWLHRPWHESLWLSGSEKVVHRDSMRCRRVVRSDKYQQLLAYQVSRLRFLDDWRGGPWHDILKSGDKPWGLREDQNQKGWFELTSGGRRQCLPLNSTQVTGLRSHFWGIDDPLDVIKVKGSVEAVRRECVMAWSNITERLWNRLHSGMRGEHSRFVSGQRLHKEDPQGHLIQLGWTHLVMPAEYDPMHPHCSPDDPRTEPGELLNPLHEPKEVLDEYKAVLGPSAYSAQYKEWPIAETGTELEEALAACPRFWEHPKNLDLDKRWCSTDATFGTTKKTSSRVAIQAWGRKGAELWMFGNDCDVMTWPEMRSRSIKFAQEQDHQFDAVVVEDKALGPALVVDLRRVLVNVEGFNPGAASKQSRLGILAARMRSQQVHLPHPDAAWLTKMSVEFGEIATLVPVARARGDKWPDTTPTQGIVRVPWVVVFEAECRQGTGRDDMPDAAAQAVIWDQREREKGRRSKATPYKRPVDMSWADGGGESFTDGF